MVCCYQSQQFLCFVAGHRRSLFSRAQAIFLGAFSCQLLVLPDLQDIAHTFLSAGFEMLENAVSDGKLYEIKTKKR
jgi:hypothetical protein